MARRISVKRHKKTIEGKSIEVKQHIRRVPYTSNDNAYYFDWVDRNQGIRRYRKVYAKNPVKAQQLAESFVKEKNGWGGRNIMILAQYANRWYYDVEGYQLQTLLNTTIEPPKPNRSLYEALTSEASFTLKDANQLLLKSWINLPPTIKDRIKQGLEKTTEPIN